MARQKNGSSNGTTAPVVRTTASVMVGSLPTALKDLIDNAAKEASSNAAAWVRGLIAAHFDFTLPTIAPRGRVSKYAHISDPEARKEARANDQKKEQATVRAVLKAIRLGEIEGVNLEDLVARLGAPRAKAEANA